ncbi:MAG: hypothetical protein COW24_04805 [Candidatus Kerfeldbacteria bacterium CG15_BIG_FIL_POST_REV_8_21_14_020_45_12]|uniref:DAGKc domain-containing protein n=1 Tax=Candidatus Kerfeldbacteria bacterium CG15_BIG_FIL_POST_REV_8_21_14_020_45_12 TaxID=2014247 RepID=A0A2M7H2N6_9BACT|nr:MAG: hypothetical protein COW24_04805 [Candidatus Kerfeldbacteria bacterium CG15_BIG_FIL_POST_REV_8_21_14_020_45_12]PJA93263.1 MAG: hypothetical protein CO132_04115 [Candidatus Kerfeldbacteria bacterium CG_4_9_14_3_um_filter_45_8]
MYFYFYDKLTQDKQFESQLTTLETRLIDLGINGRVEKLSIFKNAKELIEDGIKKGAHTVIAVGDDHTFTTAVNVVAPYDVTFGFIPLAPGSRYAKLLGMPVAEAAVDVLSKRRTLEVDLGKIGDYYFFGALQLPAAAELRLQCDEQYTVSPTSQTNRISILNAGDVLTSSTPLLADPSDGRLSLNITPQVNGGLLSRKTKTNGRASVFPAQRIDIDSTGETLKVSVENVFSVNTPCVAEIVPAQMKIIVGKGRLLDNQSDAATS